MWTGDYVTQDADGFFYFKGRADALLKVSGYRISPDEVEAALQALPMVAEVVVAGREHPPTGQAIIAAVVLAAAADNNEQALLAAARQLLPAYMVPARFVICAALPRSANGKFDRQAISRLLAVEAIQR